VRTVAVLFLVASSVVAADPLKPRLLVPAYFYPAGDGVKAWDTLLASGDKASIVAIVDPDNGPGAKADPNYEAVFRKAADSKVALIGYVTLGYGKRDPAAVKADVDRWVKSYPSVRGIFFDEQPSAADQAPAARKAFAHARERIAGAVIVSNPGTVCAKDYLEGKDAPTVCLFEGPNGLDKFTPPAWVAKADRNRIAVLAHDVKTADGMRAVLKAATAKGAGFAYVTDANPWDRLPTYWADELAAAGRDRERSK
jgi:hypothetical protein